MKALLIGGTGTLSSAVGRLLIEQGWETWVLNRGLRLDRLPSGARQLTGDMADEAGVRALLADRWFDVVVEFIAYVPEQVERDVRLFSGRCGQYIFISSASSYQKPPASPFITEETPLSNPFWQYSRDKADCEERLMQHYRNDGFPVTIVRPSHTYGERSVPIALHGREGSYQDILRIRAGKPVLVPGDGTSLWTMTHSSDFAKGFVGLMGNARAIGEAIHITSDESLTWNRIYGCIGLALGVEPRLVHVATDDLVAMDPALSGPLLGDKCNSVIFDNSKLKRLVPGFCATVRYEQGVRWTLDWVLSHPEAQRIDPQWEAFVERVTTEVEARRAPHSPPVAL